MLEIMLSKLHVTSLAIKEQIKRGKKKKELARPPPGAFFFFKPRPSQEVCFSGAVIWAAHGEKQKEGKKNPCGALNARGSERRSCAILWPVQNGNGRALLCLLND